MREARGGGGLTALTAAEAFDVVRLCPELASILLAHRSSTLDTLLCGACTYIPNEFVLKSNTHASVSQVVHAPSTRRTVRPFSLRRE